MARKPLSPLATSSRKKAAVALDPLGFTWSLFVVCLVLSVATSILGSITFGLGSSGPGTFVALYLLGTVSSLCSSFFLPKRAKRKKDTFSAFWFLSGLVLVFLPFVLYSTFYSEERFMTLVFHTTQTLTTTACSIIFHVFPDVPREALVDVGKVYKSWLRDIVCHK